MQRRGHHQQAARSWPRGPIDALVEQFFPTARVEVELGGAVAGGARRRCEASPGVVHVEERAAGDGAARYVVESARGRDVRGEIFQLAAAAEVGVCVELRRVGMTLEEVFMRIVAGEETDAAVPATPAPAPAEAEADA